MVKKGFSIAEALVVMAIISILFAAISKIVTHRPKRPVQENIHGYFECYYNGGLKQKYVRDGVESPVQSVSTCLFEPTAGVSFYNINVYGNNIYYTAFEPNISADLEISRSGNGFYLRNTTNGRSLYINSSSQTNTTITNQQLFFKALYPNSGIYNNGSFRQGIMISW